jgi:hypothetical protein
MKIKLVTLVSFPKQIFNAGSGRNPHRETDYFLNLRPFSGAGFSRDGQLSA